MNWMRREREGDETRAVEIVVTSLRIPTRKSYLLVSLALRLELWMALRRGWPMSATDRLTRSFSSKPCFTNFGAPWFLSSEVETTTKYRMTLASGLRTPSVLVKKLPCMQIALHKREKDCVNPRMLGISGTKYTYIVPDSNTLRYGRLSSTLGLTLLLTTCLLFLLLGQS